jgi:hypothetical protein
MLRLAAFTLAALSATGIPAALAQEAPVPQGAEAIDDPKLERRLGTRVSLASPDNVAPELAEGATFAPLGESSTSPYAERDDVLAASPTPPEPFVRKVPRLKIAYGRFDFVQVGAPTGTTAGASETFNVVSLDLYPVSSNWRFGLSTQYGWQDGTFRKRGDAFLAEALSLGGQLPGDVFTPFFEVFGGGGLMQRLNSNLNTPGNAYGEFGVSVGTEIFLARHAFLSLAGGYLHNYNGYFYMKKYTSSSNDVLTFKVGFGI